MPNSEYFNAPGENWSRIKAILDSPAHYLAALQAERKVSAAMRIGTACHTLVCEPHLYADTVRVAPPQLVTDSGALSTGKDARAWLASLPPDVTPLAGPEAERVQGMAAAVLAHQDAAELLKVCNRREVSFTWESMGKRRKGSADMLGPGVLVDLKSDGEWGETTTPFSFCNKADRFHYYGQLGYYDEGLLANGHQIDEMGWIVVGSKPPYNVLVIMLDRDGMAHAREEAYEAQRRLAECEASGLWPGTHPRKVTIGAPKWCGWKGQENDDANADDLDDLGLEGVGE